MKLAEALVRIKDLKGKVAELSRVLQTDMFFEKIDDMQEVPSTEGVLVELEKVTETLADLKTRIAKTNAQHGLVDKINEMEQLRSLISQLDMLARQKQRVVNLRRVDYEGPAIQIATLATYDVAALAEKVQSFRSRVRELDLELQRLNWEVDLVE